MGYNTILEYLWKGQTVGKKATDIGVVKENGDEIGAREAVIRNIPILTFVLSFVAVLVQLAALFSVLTTENNQRVFDFAAETLVVEE